MATKAVTITSPHYNVTKFSWALEVYEVVAFTSGSGDIDAADTLTQGAVTATIDSVTITSGTLGAGTAAGSLRISARAGGNFGAGAATTNTAGTLTLSGIQTTTYDDGVSVRPAYGDYMDRHAQVKGTAGASFNLKIEGGRDNATFATLNDAQGVALDITAVGIKQVQEITPYTHPRISAGQAGTTSVTVIMVCRRDRKGAD